MQNSAWKLTVACQLLSLLFSQMGRSQTPTALLTSAGILLCSCWPVGTVPVEAIWTSSRAVCHLIFLFIFPEISARAHLQAHETSFKTTGTWG